MEKVDTELDQREVLNRKRSGQERDGCKDSRAKQRRQVTISLLKPRSTFSYEEKQSKKINELLYTTSNSNPMLSTVASEAIKSHENTDKEGPKKQKDIALTLFPENKAIAQWHCALLMLLVGGKSETVLC